jgi:hypothetical protein
MYHTARSIFDVDNKTGTFWLIKHINYFVQLQIHAV